MMFEVYSGTIWASVVSILSIRSIIILLSEPDGISRTVPSGTRVSLSHIFFLMFPSRLKVAMWLMLVEIAWKSTFPSQKAAVIPHSRRKRFQSRTPASSWRTIRAIIKYGAIQQATLSRAKNTLTMYCPFFSPANSTIQLIRLFLAGDFFLSDILYLFG